MVSSCRWGDGLAGKQPDKAEPQSCLRDLSVLWTPAGRGHPCPCPLPAGLRPARRQLSAHTRPGRQSANLCLRDGSFLLAAVTILS